MSGTPDTLQFSFAVSEVGTKQVVHGQFQIRTAGDLDIAINILGQLRAYLDRRDAANATPTPGGDQDMREGERS